MKSNKIKPILPSLREKKRYLGFELMQKGAKSDFKAVSAEIMRNASKLIGDLSLANAQIHIFPEKFNGKTGIIKVNNKYLDHLKASMALSSIQIRSVAVSGMLNKIEKKIGEV